MELFYNPSKIKSKSFALQKVLIFNQKDLPASQKVLNPKVLSQKVLRDNNGFDKSFYWSV